MRLLLVEDNRALLKSLKKGFEEEGFAVDAAGDGEEGRFLAEANDYDVVVLDLMLPKVDGLTILRGLRKAGNPAHVLILTARDTPENKVRGLNAGADDYLTKPFGFEELLARVRALLRRKYRVKNPLLTVADLEIDTAARRVRRGDEEVLLRPKEYAVLEYLAHRAGRVIPRSEIWEHLYDWQDESTSNIIDVFISRLRKKIDHPPLRPLIRTVRGAGYILKGD
ncbi:MAG: response regulator transcription factor [Candidatus Aminicenantes bacterium]|nr:response regulator transcription factor [Candidatus Aminicenantes bacterium]